MREETRSRAVKLVHTVVWAFFASCVAIIPLTDVAARFTEGRRPNFDIYLPSWLAEYNKEIFGSLYVFGIICTLLAWFVPGAG